MAQEQPFSEVDLPYDLVPGAYANVLLVRHSPHEFTLDYGVVEPDDILRVTARVRVVVTLIFEMMRTINVAMSLYEAEFGPIERPRGRGEEAG